MKEYRSLIITVIAEILTALIIWALPSDLLQVQKTIITVDAVIVGIIIVLWIILTPVFRSKPGKIKSLGFWLLSLLTIALFVACVVGTMHYWPTREQAVQEAQEEQKEQMEQGEQEENVNSEESSTVIDALYEDEQSTILKNAVTLEPSSSPTEPSSTPLPTPSDTLTISSPTPTLVLVPSSTPTTTPTLIPTPTHKPETTVIPNVKSIFLMAGLVGITLALALYCSPIYIAQKGHSWRKIAIPLTILALSIVVMIPSLSLNDRNEPNMAIPELVIATESVPSPTFTLNATPAISNHGIALELPESEEYFETPFYLHAKSSYEEGKIFLMPKPEAGNGNLGGVKNGEPVLILAERGGFYFFQTEDGRLGWNGKAFFSD